MEIVRTLLRLSEHTDDFISQLAEEHNLPYNKYVEQVFNQIKERGYYIRHKNITEKLRITIDSDIENMIKQNGS